MGGQVGQPSYPNSPIPGAGMLALQQVEAGKGGLHMPLQRGSTAGY